MTRYKKGNIVRAEITGISKYGIFVKIDELYSGLIHISEVSNKFVSDLNYYAKENEIIYVEIIDVNEENKQLKLSIKNIDYRGKGIRKKKIIETKHGFDTLAYKLPFWIKGNLENKIEIK